MPLIRDDDAPTFVLGIIAALTMAGVVLLSGPVRVVVEGGHYRYEPAYIRLKITVEPHAANRGLWVQADSGSFATSSYEQLEGEASSRTRWVVWKDLPAGAYTVTATVDRGAERSWHGQAGFTVLSSDGMMIGLTGQ